MKPHIAKISLVVALVLFFSGFMVLCYCPGWYALAAGFAGVTVLVGAGRTRTWGILWVVASLALAAIHAYSMVGERQKVHETKLLYEKKRRQSTNQTERFNSPAPGSQPFRSE